jgi:hypothetical protein
MKKRRLRYRTQAALFNELRSHAALYELQPVRLPDIKVDTPLPPAHHRGWKLSRNFIAYGIATSTSGRAKICFDLAGLRSTLLYHRFNSLSGNPRNRTTPSGMHRRNNPTERINKDHRNTIGHRHSNKQTCPRSHQPIAIIIHTRFRNHMYCSAMDLLWRR